MHEKMVWYKFCTSRPASENVYLKSLTNLKMLTNEKHPNTEYGKVEHFTYKSELQRDTTNYVLSSPLHRKCLPVYSTDAQNVYYKLLYYTFIMCVVSSPRNIQWKFVCAIVLSERTSLLMMS